MCICLDWASCYKNRVYRRSPWGLPNDDLPFDFSLAYCPRRLGHFFQFDVQTSCLWASDTLLLCSWDRMTSLYNRWGLGWWWMKFSLGQPRPAWSGCCQRKHPWSSITGASLLSPPGHRSVGIGNYLWGRPSLSPWNLHTSSTFRWPSWPSLHWLANWDNILPLWTLHLATYRLLLL